MKTALPASMNMVGGYIIIAGVIGHSPVAIVCGAVIAIAATASAILQR